MLDPFVEALEELLVEEVCTREVGGVFVADLDDAEEAGVVLIKGRVVLVKVGCGVFGGMS